MLSCLCLCIPREWSLHCSALSGPFATTGSGKRLLVRQLEVYGKGSPSGEELEGESPRGGERVPVGGKPPYHFGIIFEKKVVLKSHSKSSGGKKGFMNDFSELWGVKGGPSRCFGVTFGTFFGDFLDYG